MKLATHAIIAKPIGDDEGYEAIYCHFDGSPMVMLPVLNTHYTDPNKVNQLIKLGDLSDLGPEIGEKQDFNKPHKGWCLAYGRDRGEEGTKATKVSSEARLRRLAQSAGVDYIYIYDPDEKKWSWMRSSSL